MIFKRKKEKVMIGTLSYFSTSTIVLEYSYNTKERFVQFSTGKVNHKTTPLHLSLSIFSTIEPAMAGAVQWYWVQYKYSTLRESLVREPRDMGQV
jgi:hypothetical protein